MQQIDSSIEIDAPASLVWALLTDFASYKRWNPFIRAVHGKPSTGNELRVILQRQGQVAESTNSLLTRVREPHELRWRQRLLAPGLYTIVHSFRIESLPAGRVRFHQTEQVKGLFASLLGRGTPRATEASFHAMNYALKAHAERMQAGLVAAGHSTVQLGLPVGNPLAITKSNRHDFVASVPAV
jgi:hypothetical protein